jgi:hypothetical protein
MRSLYHVLQACRPLLPEPFGSAHARLFAQEEHLAALAARLLAFARQGVPAEPPPPRFAAECTPPLEAAFAPFRDAVAAWHDDSYSSALPRQFTDALVVAGTRNLLVLLGQRLTPASVTDARAIPPTRARLLASARRPHGNADPLTVAGRALAKHVHRSPAAFWGQVSGSAAEKNAAAEEVLARILGGATWWNVFGHFKHDLVYEARVPTGHGARWGRLGDEFIGFLEPFDELKCPSVGAG